MAEEDSPEATLPLLEGMANRNGKLEEFLRYPNCYQCFMLKNITIIRYLKKHIKNLFKLAMTDSQDEPSVVAYRICAQDHSPLLQDMVNEKLLLKYYPTVFESKETKMNLIGRYTVIFTSVCSAEVNNMSEEQCQLYRKLIERVDCLPIYNLYENLFTKDNEYGNTRLHMLKMHFEKILPDLIYGIDTNAINFDDPMDPGTIKLAAYYDFIKWACQHEWFSRHFNNNDLIYEVLGDERKAPTYVLNAKWGAVESYIDKSKPEVCVMFMFRALGVLSTVPDEIHAYHVHALNVIKKLAPKYPEGLEDDFLKNLAEIMLKHQNNTFMLLAIVDFVDAVHNTQGVDVRIAENLMPKVTEVAFESRLAIRSCVFKLLELLVARAMRSKQLAIKLPRAIDFDKFKNQYVVFNQIMTSYYGGLSPMDQAYVKEHYGI